MQIILLICPLFFKLNTKQPASIITKIAYCQLKANLWSWYFHSFTVWPLKKISKFFMPYLAKFITRLVNSLTRGLTRSFSYYKTAGFLEQSNRTLFPLKTPKPQLSHPIFSPAMHYTYDFVDRSLQVQTVTNGKLCKFVGN